MKEEWTQKESSQIPSEEKRESDVKGYGGYAARHRFEQEKDKKKSLWRSLFGVLSLSVLLFLSILGCVALFRGDFFPEEPVTREEGSNTIKVPTQQQLAEVVRDPKEMIAEVDLSLVTVELFLEDGSSRFGTGFFISQDGHVLCSDTLWQGEPQVKELRVYTVDGTCLSAVFVGRLDQIGAALVMIESGFGTAAVSVGNFSFLERGETLYAVGAANTKDFPGTVLSGVISSVSGSLKVVDKGKTTTVPVLFLDLEPNESLWGAPVVDNTGSVVGFCTHAVSAPFGNQAAAVSIHSVFTMVNELLGES